MQSAARAPHFLHHRPGNGGAGRRPQQPFPLCIFLSPSTLGSGEYCCSPDRERSVASPSALIGFAVANDVKIGRRVIGELTLRTPANIIRCIRGRCAQRLRRATPEDQSLAPRRTCASSVDWQIRRTSPPLAARGSQASANNAPTYEDDLPEFVARY